MSEHSSLPDDRAREVELWDQRVLTPAGWADAPEAVPRASESVAISVRFPAPMLDVLKEFAHRAGVGYQSLIKQWLNERIREETLKRHASVPE